MTGTYDILIQKGATFTRVLTWKDESGNPINLTGCVARLQMRRKLDSDEPFISLTSFDGIVLGGEAGTITITISSEDTSEIEVKSGVYDLEIEDSNGFVTRLLQGRVTVSGEVTR